MVIKIVLRTISCFPVHFTRQMTISDLMILLPIVILQWLKLLYFPYKLAAVTPRKKVSVSRTLGHNASLHKEVKDERRTHSIATMPHPSSAHAQLYCASQDGDDSAYSILHPSGVSTGTLNTGDSGFEDVQPLQRLDQEPVSDRDKAGPVGKYTYHILHYTSGSSLTQAGHMFIHLHTMCKSRCLWEHEWEWSFHSHKWNDAMMIVQFISYARHISRKTLALAVPVWLYDKQDRHCQTTL